MVYPSIETRLQNMALALADPNVSRGLIFTFVGEGGLGKTALGACFPAPIFVPTEDGLIPPHAARTTLCKSSDDVIARLREIGNEPIGTYKTVVLDTITQLNVLIEREIVDSDPKHPKSINTALGGYGAGQGAVSTKHMEIREWCGMLAELRQLNIVFLAHATTETVKPPDQDEYYRYSIRMNQRSVSHYSDNTDLVGYVKLQTHTRKTGEGLNERTLATSTGARVISCYPHASSIAKNRFNITSDIVYEQGINPFEPLVGPS
jgi:hypothetical protein